MADPSPLVILARIGAPHGVRGQVRLKPFGDDHESLTAYGPLLRADGGGTLAITGIRAAKGDMLVVSFDGVASREMAEKLNGVELGIPRDRLPKPDDDDFYHHDLIGLSAILPDGTSFGVIRSVENFGAGDLLDVAPERGGPSVLVPFTHEIVPDIDVAAGHVRLDPPQGLLDPPSKKPKEAAGD